MDWTRPVPLSEFFLPLDDGLSFGGHRACVSDPDLRWAAYNPMVESRQRRNDTAIQETIDAAEGALTCWNVLSQHDPSLLAGFNHIAHDLGDLRCLQRDSSRVYVLVKRWLAWHPSASPGCNMTMPAKDLNSRSTSPGQKAKRGCYDTGRASNDPSMPGLAAARDPWWIHCQWLHAQRSAPRRRGRTTTRSSSGPTRATCRTSCAASRRAPRLPGAQKAVLCFAALQPEQS